MRRNAHIGWPYAPVLPPYSRGSLTLQRYGPMLAGPVRSGKLK